MLWVFSSAVMDGMKRAVPSPLIVTPGVTGGFTGTPAGAGSLAFLVLAVSTSTIATKRLSLREKVRAGPVTRFPDPFAVLPAPIEAIILCAEVRAGDGGGAVIIADAPVMTALHMTRTVHLGGASVSRLST